MIPILGKVPCLWLYDEVGELEKERKNWGKWHPGKYF